MTKRRATYQDIIDAPEHMIAEILDGELALTRRTPVEAAVHSVLTADIGRAVGRREGGWIILSRPELRLGEDVCVPDLAGWTRERMPYVPGEDELFVLPPDWVCEVMSPESERRDRKKLFIYARAGVQHAWLVKPALRLLERYRRTPEGYWCVLDGYVGDAHVRAEPFATVELELGDLWRDLAPAC